MISNKTRAPSFPTLIVRRLLGRPAVRAVLELTELGRAYILDGSGQLHSCPPLSEAEYEALDQIESESQLAVLLQDRHWDANPAGVWNNLSSALDRYLSAGARAVFGSERAASGVPLEPLLTRWQGGDADQTMSSFCARDEECKGAHTWIGIQPDEARPQFLLWHLNRSSGQVIPPEPLVVR